MRRQVLLAVLVVAALAVPGRSRGDGAARILVLPLRTIGVSDTLAAVVGDLLRGALEERGAPVVPRSALAADLAIGDAACDDAECAAAAAAKHATSRVVYGSLSRLGDKIILRIRALHTDDAAPFFADQIAATTEEDLDAVARRAAEGIAAARPNLDRATIDTVIQEETLEPRRRSSRSAVGIRAGFLFPVDDSYGGADRLTNLRLAIRYETRNFLVDSTPLLGFAWGRGNLEWTALDLFGARVFGLGDYAQYVGVGLGVHSVRVERRVTTTTNYNGMVYTYWEEHDQSATTLTADAGVGLLAFRTYDFSIVVDVRYHFVFADFDDLDSRGAHGIAITFGTSR